MTIELLTIEVPHEMAGMRLDAALAELFSEYSRSKLQAWVKAGRVKINGEILKAKGRDKIEGGEFIELDAEPEVIITYEPENIALDILFEDDDILILNKSAGMVVHPAIGNWSGTLLNALLFHAPQLETLPRAGIVHRIDKDTSGLLMVAKTLQAHNSLTEQLQARTIHREYQAITHNRMIAGGTIDEPIGRHPTDRLRYAVTRDGKEAVTHYRVINRFKRHTHIQVKLETGRTHQIRVHMGHVKFPLLGDQLYSGRFKMPAKCGEALEEVLRGFKRQALHAAKLGLVHPTTNAYMEWEQPLPDDMVLLLAALAKNDAEEER